MTSEESHMSKYLSQFTGEQKSTCKIISEDKFIKIVYHLKNHLLFINIHYTYFFNWLFIIFNYVLPRDLGITFIPKTRKFQDGA